MRKFFFIIMFSIGFTVVSPAQKLKPYTLAESLDMTMEQAKTKISADLSNNGFEILGSYQVADDANRYMYAFTSPELKSAVTSIGAKTGFAAVLRLAITMENNKAIISYTTPNYWGNAYFRKNYSKVSTFYDKLSEKLKNVFSGTSTFGSKKGLSVNKLKKYHYMIAMPHFDNDVDLGSFTSYEEAVSKIDKNLKKKNNISKVYEISFPDQELKLYGIDINGVDGETKFMPIIDIGTPKHTAFLPYELLVYKNKAYMLHGRFRIALSFPDLTMGTFMKIMSTPGNIEDALKQACK